jgi:hypothetical protein
MKATQQAKNPIQKAILETRSRTGDDRIGVSVGKGMFNITSTEVINGKWITTYIKRSISGPDLIGELNQLK